MKRWLKRLGLALLVLSLAAALAELYFMMEMVGAVEGLSWRDQHETWAVTRPGTRLLVGVHAIGRTRPVSWTIRNTGAKDLLLPFVVRRGPNPWMSFTEQAKRVTAGLDDPADQLAVLAEWIRAHVQPASTDPATRKRTVHPWALMYAYGFGQCGDLSYLMYLAATALRLPARMIDLRSHMLTEVFYANAWHVYDLTYTYGLHDAQGNTPSFAEVNSGGSLKKWVNNYRPWLLGGIETEIWTRLPTIAPTEIPAGWDAPPPPLVLRAGDSWTVRSATAQEALGGRPTGSYARMALGVLDLSLPDYRCSLKLPFPILRATLTTDDAVPPREPVNINLGQGEGRMIRQGWQKRPTGGWELLLADVRNRYRPIYDMALTVSRQSAAHVRLRVEVACAAWWLVGPDPGLTVLEVGWEDGDRLDFTMNWQHK